MGLLRNILVVSILCFIIAGCDFAVKHLPNGYNITEMNDTEFRLVTPSREVLPSNVKSYSVARKRYVFGECTRMYLDARSEPNAKDGWFILDTATGKYDYGLTAFEYGRELQAADIATSPLNVLLPMR